MQLKSYDQKLLSDNRAVGSFPGVGRLIDQSGDAVEGREIKARSADHFARSTGKKNRIHF